MGNLQTLLCAGLVVVAGCGRGVAPRVVPPGPRIVSLAPNLTEIVCAVGGAGRLVGRTSACDYPPDAVAAVPVLGDFGKPSLELLTAARPTVVIEVDLHDESVAAHIERLGIRRQRVPCMQLDDIPGAIREVGRLVECVARAEALAARIEAGIDAARQAVGGGARPAVYVEIWHDPLTTAGTGTFLSELVALAGGRNLGDAGGKGYFQVSPEWVIAQDPDVILCAYMSRGGDATRQVTKRAGWKQVAAVANGAVHAGFDNSLILRPGPRVLEGLQVLKECIRP